MAMSPAIQSAGRRPFDRPLGPSDRQRVYPCYGAASIPENVRKRILRADASERPERLRFPGAGSPASVRQACKR